MDTNKLKEAANLAKLGCFPEARQLYEELVVENPKDPLVLYNLGMCFTELDQPEKAIIALNRSLEFDSTSANTYVALGYAYSRLNKGEESKTFLRALKSSGIRMDAVMYMVSALKLFKNSGEEKTKQISFEIALKGRSGLEVNNPDIRYALKTLPGEFSGLQLVSYMFAGFKQFAPEKNVRVDLSNVRVDLSKEYEMALSIFGNKGVS